VGRLSLLSEKEGDKMESASVCVVGGYRAGHPLEIIRKEGYWARGADLKFLEFANTAANDFIIRHLKDQLIYRRVIGKPLDIAYKLAAHRRRAGFIFTGENDAEITHS
jgi:hypothetical protein